MQKWENNTTIKQEGINWWKFDSQRIVWKTGLVTLKKKKKDIFKKELEKSLTIMLKALYLNTQSHMKILASVYW